MLPSCVRRFHTHGALFRRHHKQQHYDILQVQQNADKKAIKAQFYRLSKRYHPDLNPHNKEAHEKFLQINEAYAVLGNEANRRQYDADIATTAPGSRHSPLGNEHSAFYGASRPNYSGPSVAWRARARQPRNTGSASARAQADQHAAGSASASFNQQEHFARHYEAEEHRRRERIHRAAQRRQEKEDSDEPEHIPRTLRLNIWSRLWRLGVLLAGITWATKQVYDYTNEMHEDDDKRKRNPYLAE
ncbi:DnaJ domain-containing protein [Gongronella butleri]|nr:DnaJ domain-containing protein [Gongronella butleri]